MDPEDAQEPQPSDPSQPSKQPVSAEPPTPRAQGSRSARSAKKARPVGAGRSAQKGHSTVKGRSAKPAPSARRPSTAHPAHPAHPKAHAEHVPSFHPPKEEVVKRAEERAKVPDRFRDSLKRFFCSPTGMLKILRLGLIIGALACFIIVQAHESYIAITVLEICIVLFFILTYMLTLHHLLTCLHWPLLDLINSFITAVFLLVVAIFTMQERKRRHLFYVGGTLCLTAAIVCLLDAFVVTKTMRSNMKNLLKITVKTSKSHERLSLRNRSQMHGSTHPDTHRAHH